MRWFAVIFTMTVCAVTLKGDDQPDKFTAKVVVDGEPIVAVYDKDKGTAWVHVGMFPLKPDRAQTHDLDVSLMFFGTGGHPIEWRADLHMILKHHRSKHKLLLAEQDVAPELIIESFQCVCDVAGLPTIKRKATETQNEYLDMPNTEWAYFRTSLVDLVRLTEGNGRIELAKNSYVLAPDARRKIRLGIAKAFDLELEGLK